MITLSPSAAASRDGSRTAGAHHGIGEHRVAESRRPRLIENIASGRRFGRHAQSHHAGHQSRRTHGTDPRPAAPE